VSQSRKLEVLFPERSLGSTFLCILALALALEDDVERENQGQVQGLLCSFIPPSSSSFGKK
jgi:hypothetical protein